MSNDHVKADIPAYLNGDLPEAGRRKVEGHAADCDGCRHALNKARAKQARSKRQALKKANPDPLPNLLMNRLGRQSGLNRPPSRAPWAWLFAALLVGGGLYVLRHVSFYHPMSAKGEEDVALSTSVPSASQAASSFEISKSSPLAASAVEDTSQPAAPPPEPTATETPRTWTGPDSAVRDFREVVIKGRTSWRTLWAEMGQPEPAPRINFGDTVLVGVFAGERPNAGYQVLLGTPKDLGDELQVPYRVTATVISTNSVTAVTHPYALMTLPRVAKAVHLLRESD